MATSDFWKISESTGNSSVVGGDMQWSMVVEKLISQNSHNEIGRDVRPFYLGPVHPIREMHENSYEEQMRRRTIQLIENQELNYRDMERLVEATHLLRCSKTPLLLMDKATILHKYKELESHFPEYKICYAVKANDHVEILRILAEAGSCFEVASKPELLKLLDVGVEARRIITSHPIKSPHFIQLCRELHVEYLCIDSKDEIDKIKRIYPSAKTYLRLEIENPESSWPLSDKFGLLLEEVEEILNYAASQNVNVCGLTFHTGSQNNSSESFRRALTISREVFEMGKAQGFDMTLLNIGGGFPVDYFEACRELSDFQKTISEEVEKFPNPERLILQMEPGRRIVAEAGLMMTTVIGTAQRRGKNWLYLDVGLFNGLMESIGGIKYSYKTNANGELKNWIIAGPSCDSMDIVDRNVLLATPKIGDKVFILSAGAYTTVYAANFNGYLAPEITVI